MAAERALEQQSGRLPALPVQVGDLWNPATCPPALLRYLAWAVSVFSWNDNWGDDRKRSVIAASIQIHRHKGTPWAVRLALQVAGYGDATLIEHTAATLYDGSIVHDGSKTYVAADAWAEYRVKLNSPITVSQAATVRDVLGAVAPARCVLKAITFTQANNSYNGAIRYDGTYTHGVA